MRQSIRDIAYKCNLPRLVCHMLLGHQAKPPHRMAVGVIVMGIGVMIAKAAMYVHFQALEMLIDGSGYAIHALGTTPFIEWLADRVKMEGD